MIYDISQPVFGCEVYPGDPLPEKRLLKSIAGGDKYNLTSLTLCVHNGTHVDAPSHFLAEGKGIGRLPLSKFIGRAYVGFAEGELRAADAARLLEEAAAACGEAPKRLLIKGEATVTVEAAEVFAAAGLDLLGNESQSVGPMESPMPVHLILLGAETVLLEGIRLAAVPEGAYLLCCAPLDLGDTDGSPCRAVLIDER